MFGIKHIKYDSMTYVLHFKNGNIKREGRGLSFFYYSPTSSITAIPMGSKDIQFIFNESTKDFQTITIQGHNNQKWVDLSVTDSGPGIPAEIHDRIFELDFSGRNTTRPGKLGFGLWWVKTLMTRLGGTIFVESDPEASNKTGTTFRIRLPAAEIES